MDGWTREFYKIIAMAISMTVAASIIIYAIVWTVNYTTPESTYSITTPTGDSLSITGKLYEHDAAYVFITKDQIIRMPINSTTVTVNK